MSDDAAFVDEIRRHPGDIVPRLIYADYLEEAGSARGELIRVQSELAQLPAGDPQRSALFDRERALLNQHGEMWLQPLRELGVAGVTQDCFSGGLLERARLPAERFLQVADQLCALEPALGEVALNDLPDHVESLAAMILPDQIRALDLSACRIDPQVMGQLATAAWWAQLERVDLRFNQLRDDGLRRLASLAAVGAPYLRQLNLSSNGIGPAGIRELVQSRLYPRLEELDLSVNNVGAMGVQFLMRGEATRLRKLNLSRCGITSVALFRTGFEALEELIIRSNQITDWSGVIERPNRLRVLDGRSNPAVVRTQTDSGAS